MIAELNKASAIEGLGKSQGLIVSIAKTQNYVGLRITFCQSLSRSKGRPNERSPLADGRPCFGCSWEEGTMVRHDTRARIKVPCGFQAKPPTRVPCKDMAALLHQLYATIGNRFCKRSKITTRGHVGQVGTFACCYVTILANSVLVFLSAAKR
jgi:hypothetical protein